MFTGIVTALGEVKAVERQDGLSRLTVSAPFNAAEVAIGASHRPRWLLSDRG